jgi:hypothetical protein
VSRLHTIAKLEVLLARVRARGQRPGASAATTPTAAPEGAPHPEDSVGFDAEPDPSDDVSTLPPPLATEKDSVALEDEATVVFERDAIPSLRFDGDLASSPAPEGTLAERGTGAASTETKAPESEGEPARGPVAEEAPAGESFESRERLVAAAPAFEATDLAPEVAPLPAIEGARAAEVPVASEEPPPEIISDVEDVEEAPVSSRRPVALEPEQRLAEMAFGAEEPSPPRHTPPPESGRLPAAPPLAEFGDITGVRDASAPAHRLEGADVRRPDRREGADANTDVAAAEDAPVAAPVEVVAAFPATVPAQPFPQPPAAEPLRALVPESTHAVIAPSDAVGDVLGEAQRFAPPSFVALLDASLAL